MSQLKSTSDSTVTAVPVTFADLIIRWATPDDFAADLGVRPAHGGQMKSLSWVPCRYWEGMLAGARRRGLRLTAEEIIAATIAHHATKRPRRAAWPAARASSSMGLE